MVALGFGKFARADRIFALERITGEERGDGRRTRVWIDGVADPLIASRTEGTIGVMSCHLRKLLAKAGFVELEETRGRTQFWRLSDVDFRFCDPGQSPIGRLHSRWWTRGCPALGPRSIATWLAPTSSGRGGRLRSSLSRLWS